MIPPNSNQNAGFPHPRLPEEERARKLVDYAARERLAAACERFQKAVDADSALKSFIKNHDDRRIKNLPAELKLIQREIRLKHLPLMPTSYIDAVLGVKAGEEETPAAPAGRSWRSWLHKSAPPGEGQLRNRLFKALGDSGLTEIVREIGQGYRQINDGWDVNSLLAACAAFASRTSGVEITLAATCLSSRTKALDSKLSPVKANESGRYESPQAKSDRLKAESQIIPRSHFADAELFSHVSRRCGNYPQLPEQISSGFHAAFDLSKTTEDSYGDNRGAIRFWNNINGVRNLVAALSSGETRRKIEELSTGEEGKAMLHVLAAYDASDLSAAARAFEAKRGPGAGRG